MLTRDQALVMIEFAIKEGYKLNDWEQVFIKNIQRMGTLRPLSTKQETIVQRIYEKAVGGGDKVYHERIKK